MPRIEMLGLDWLNLYGRWSKIKGNTLLDLLRDKIAINDKERVESGFGGGWHFIKYPEMGLRIATKDDGDATINFQGMWFQGGCSSAYEELQRIIKAVKTIPDIEWSITRVDVARTMFGATLEDAFPHYKSKKYIWDFSIGNADDHNTKKRKTDWKYTGFKLTQGRWRLGVYDKAWDLIHGPYTNPMPVPAHVGHPIRLDEGHPSGSMWATNPVG
ncbi:MAG: hypothetical protein KDD22_00650 [Bdellovibrionales bacterium]|nr:hypothetical protein [Bdellovibrionales bacterium]